MAAADLILYTDGACKGNGINACAAGVGVYHEPGSTLNLSCALPPIFGTPTNQKAELYAAIQAVKTGIRSLIANHPDMIKPVTLEIRLDSEYVRKGATEWMHKWKKNGWLTSTKKPVQNKELWMLLDNAMQLQTPSMQIRWIHVAGHVGINGNERADQLARSGEEPTRQRVRLV
jgi:ribonuclease HI